MFYMSYQNSIKDWQLYPSFAARTALIQPQDRLMGLGLPDGGHLTHGCYVRSKRAGFIHSSTLTLPTTDGQEENCVFNLFPVFSLRSWPSPQLIDYGALAQQGNIFNPHLIICGASAYPRDWDYAALKAICEKEGAYLMADIAHTSGLIAAQQLNNPFDYCDVVTTTT
jgi:glycine hydroxymethyltransferase